MENWERLKTFGVLFLYQQMMLKIKLHYGMKIEVENIN